MGKNEIEQAIKDLKASADLIYAAFVASSEQVQALWGMWYSPEEYDTLAARVKDLEVQLATWQENYSAVVTAHQVQRKSMDAHFLRLQGALAALEEENVSLRKSPDWVDELTQERAQVASLTAQLTEMTEVARRDGLAAVGHYQKWKELEALRRAEVAETDMK